MRVGYIWKKLILNKKHSINGRLTQLVECHLDMVKVTGSSPASPTKNILEVARDFELAELKLLVDSVQSSKFITKKKE